MFRGYLPGKLNDISRYGKLLSLRKQDIKICGKKSLLPGNGIFHMSGFDKSQTP